MSGLLAPAGPAAGALERLRGRIVVVKFGGNAMVDDSLKRAFAQDVAELRAAGVKPVVVHGGGPQISAQLARHGLESRFEAGLRVTTPEAMDVVRMVLSGKVQRELVGLLNAHGPYAVGLTGEDAHTLTAEKHYARVAGEPVDIGMVGTITKVDAAAVRVLLDHGHIPVVSPVARGEAGEIYNVNADTAAGAIAAALEAEALVVLTDVPGLYAHWPHSDRVVDRLTAGDLDLLLPGLDGGMLPKMEACREAVRAGVPSAQVLDGRVPHALRTALLTPGASGTTVLPDTAGEARA
ncbi:acetylglutamate kinase [Streptomyces liangshanensis]|uniref:Acetylglutamate kinase n=1 Tax=Streptomyces liangshanensis TaxID=2717324 RepID=A0A6G9H6S4_9ACTN|nr:acetylglutamate kinase [Streptomyces liangshanensis]QIQ06006.1 acetylglutamate kinase [Streptomyces liangshanensis]